MSDQSERLEQLVSELEVMAEGGAIARAELADRLSNVAETLVDNAALKGVPLSRDDDGKDIIVQEATPNR